MANDPYWNSVVLACHFDGANDSVVFTDEKGHAITVSGNARLTTTSPKFGATCATFDGAGDYVSLADSADMEFGAGDFTIEFWMKTTQSLQYACPIGRDTGSFAAGAWAVLLNATAGQIQFWNASYSTSAALLSPATAPGVNNGAWHHVAVVRNGAAFALYVDGTSRATATWTGTIADVALGINIGRDPGYSRDFNGQLDDLRITKGVARYTSDFSVPTEAFPNRPMQLSGTVKDSSGNFAARTVRAYKRSTGALSDSDTSSASDGAFTLDAADDTVHYVICLDDDINENALIFDNLTPV